MKTVAKDLNLLDIDDIEEALSEYLGEKIHISDVECVLTYCIPRDTEMPIGMYLDFNVNDNYLFSMDIFSNEEY